MSAYPTRVEPGKGSPFARELIEKEIGHLRKGKSVRHGPNAGPRLSSWLVTVALLGLFWLYAMDPFLYAYHRGEAIRTYLYLHNYGDDKRAATLAGSGLFDPYDIQLLDKKQGSFQDYFHAMQGADEKAERLLAYMNQVYALHHDRATELNPLNRLRYFVFVKTGLIPPTRWEFLNPSIK